MLIFILMYVCFFGILSIFINNNNMFSKTIDMSDKNKEKKVVRIQENDLVELINNIVTEAVSEKKKVWVAENNKANAAKDSLMESRIAKLEAKFGNAKVTKVAAKK